VQWSLADEHGCNAAANADPVEFRLKYLDPNVTRGIEVLNRAAALAK